MELTAEALDKIIADSAAKVMGAKVDALKAEIIADTKNKVDTVEKKILFAGQDGFGDIGGSKTLGGSIVDFSSLKALAGMPMNFGPDEAKNGAAMGAAFAGIGSPWKKLSPTMEKFAKLLATGFKQAGLTQLGYAFLEDFTKDCKAQMALFTKSPAAQSEGTNADGGYTVPIEFAATVVEFAFQLSPILSKIWRVPMNTSTVKYPKLSQQEGNYFGGVKITYANEGAVPSPATQKVAFEQNVFTANKVLLETAFTSELIEDSLINIVNYVTGVITRAYMYELERCVIRGTGSGQPRGIIEDVIVKANAVSRSGGAGKVIMADVYNLEGHLDEMFTNLAYITRRSTISTIRQGLSSASNAFLKETWDEANGPTLVKSMNGYPYYVTRNCHQTGSLGDIICGDLGYYMLAIRRDMRIDMSDAPLWTSDQISLRLSARYDGMPGTSFAFKVLSGTGS